MTFLAHPRIIKMKGEWWRPAYQWPVNLLPRSTGLLFLGCSCLVYYINQDMILFYYYKPINYSTLLNGINYNVCARENYYIEEKEEKKERKNA